MEEDNKEKEEMTQFNRMPNTNNEYWILVTFALLYFHNREIFHKIKQGKKEFLMKSQDTHLKGALRKSLIWTGREQVIDTLHKGFESQGFDVSFVRNPIIITDSHTLQKHHRDVVPISLPKHIKYCEF